MKILNRIFISIITGIILLSATGCGKNNYEYKYPEGSISHPRFGHIMENEILLIFKDGVSNEEAQSVFDSISANTFEQLKSPGFYNFYDIKLKEETTPEEFENIIDQLRENELVESAVPNGIENPL